MRLDERAALPPPPNCRTCMHLETWRTADGYERTLCLRAYAMHDNCGWHRPKNATLMQEKTT